jgi:hypothetical protein
MLERTRTRTGDHLPNCQSVIVKPARLASYDVFAGQPRFVERTGLEPATPCLQSR